MKPNLKILYEDNHIIVVEKIPNVVVQEDETKDLDLLTMVKNYIKEKYQKPGNVYVGLVHRLDRPVGGVMVFAKTSKAAARLSEQIKAKVWHKTYLALVHGKTLPSAKLVNFLEKDETTRISKVVNQGGKEAILSYQTLKYNQDENLSLIEINLETGRHHQIRVQLSYAGFPIYGDQKYGQNEPKVTLRLWANKLKIMHPITKELMEFVSEPSWRNYE